MKQSFLKFAGKKFITATFISASILFTSFSVSAATGNHPVIEILSNDKPSIQFTGSTSDALLFKVHVNNDKADNFTLTIKNDDGVVLFSKSFNDVNFEKQFRILKGDDNNSRYYFTISSSNKGLEETYVVSSLVHIVNDVTVNKL
jgi:methenyltetrahydromethanopterin cyclohydrolase